MNLLMIRNIGFIGSVVKCWNSVIILTNWSWSVSFTADVIFFKRSTTVQIQLDANCMHAIISTVINGKLF